MQQRKNLKILVLQKTKNSFTNDVIGAKNLLNFCLSHENAVIN